MNSPRLMSILHLGLTQLSIDKTMTWRSESINPCEHCGDFHIKCFFFFCLFGKSKPKSMY